MTCDPNPNSSLEFKETREEFRFWSHQLKFCNPIVTQNVTSSCIKLLFIIDYLSLFNRLGPKLQDLEHSLLSVHLLAQEWRLDVLVREIFLLFRDTSIVEAMFYILIAYHFITTSLTSFVYVSFCRGCNSNPIWQYPKKGWPTWTTSVNTVKSTNKA